jgi:hypothetical protein
MKKLKVKRYQEGGAADSDYDEIGAIARGLSGVEAKKYGIASGAEFKAPEPSDAKEEDLSPKNFKQAFAEARRGGDKTFMWRGKKYTTEMAEPVRRLGAKETPNESAAESARLRRVPQASKEEMERRARMERQQALETSSPETALIGGPSLRAVHGAAKALAAKEGAKGVARRIEPHLGDMKDITPRAAQIGKEPLKLGREPLKIGMKKGGLASASKRADGMAQRGKTRGRIC